MSEQWKVSGGGDRVDIRSRHNRVIAVGVLRKDAERIVADHQAALPGAPSGDMREALQMALDYETMSSWDFEQTYGKRFHDCDHERADRYRAALAATGRPAAEGQAHEIDIDHPKYRDRDRKYMAYCRA